MPQPKGFEPVSHFWWLTAKVGSGNALMAFFFEDKEQYDYFINVEVQAAKDSNGNSFFQILKLHGKLDWQNRKTFIRDWLNKLGDPGDFFASEFF